MHYNIQNLKKQFILHNGTLSIKIIKILTIKLYASKYMKSQTMN